MNKLVIVASIVLFFSAVWSHPIDEEDEIIEFVPMRRYPRGIPPQAQFQGRPKLVLYKPLQQGSPMEPLVASSRKEPVAAETGYGHSQHPYDYVDYGAYTGGYGAFGWYTDHPVYTYGGGY